MQLQKEEKHLKNLILANQQGYKSYLLFLVQIEKCKSFSIASDIDPQYFKVFKEALKKMLMCFVMIVNLQTKE